jgi:uncharacterized membrane protein YhaH (DUF805 family)
MKSIFNIILTNYKKSFDFKGRQSRFDYWMFILFIIIITFVVMYLSNSKIINDNISYLLFINIIPFLSSTTRRLHDGEKNNQKTFTGLAFFVSFIIINSFFDLKIGNLKIFSAIWFIMIVIFLCRESNPKANGYGKLEKF